MSYAMAEIGLFNTTRRVFLSKIADYQRRKAF